MIRIGMIGSQSMHARVFAQACNLPDKSGVYAIPDCRVVAICGLDDTMEHTQEAARLGEIPGIVDRPEELFTRCDAVMVLTRDGNTHLPLGLPFLEQGYPVFLDKPVCISREDIEKLKGAVQKQDCILAGGSGMQYNQDIIKLRAQIDRGDFGVIRGIVFNHNGDIDSPYGGIFFYVSHGIETVRGLLGDGIRSVQTAVLSHNQFSVYFKYKDKFANLILTGRQEYFVTLYGEKANISQKIDTEDIFRETMKDFCRRIREREYTRDVSGLTAHVKLLQSIDASIHAGREVMV